MDKLELMKARHSVRHYRDLPIEQDKREILQNKINDINQNTGLNIQIFFDEPKCFDNFKAHYGKFSGVSNYISLVGNKSKTLEETSGYYGEELVMLAQELGLNTCWVALTHGKSKATIKSGQKEVCIIALGYGETQGSNRKSKDFSDVAEKCSDAPKWFKEGVEAALLAPTAINQQKFMFYMDGDEPRCKVKGIGSCTKIDLGIVEYHFDAVTGKHTLNS